MTKAWYFTKENAITLNCMEGLTHGQRGRVADILEGGYNLVWTGEILQSRIFLSPAVSLFR